MLKALAGMLFGNGRESKDLAKSRLHFVLVQDRTGLTNESMAKFRGELVQVIQKYFVIDEQGFDIAYEREDDSTTLVINSPVVVKRQEVPGGVTGSEKVAANGSSGSTPSAGNTAAGAGNTAAGAGNGKRKAFATSKASGRRSRRKSSKGKPASANA